MSQTLLLHLVFAGAWLGCILVEALFEHGSGGGSDMRLFISKLHWRVDLFIEIPAFAGVLLTGGFLIAEASMTSLLWTKAAFGMIAILFNIACVWLVRVRLAHALSGDAEGGSVRTTGSISSARLYWQRCSSRSPSEPMPRQARDEWLALMHRHCPSFGVELEKVALYKLLRRPAVPGEPLPHDGARTLRLQVRGWGKSQRIFSSRFCARSWPPAAVAATPAPAAKSSAKKKGPQASTAPDTRESVGIVST